jgi:ATP-binding cassette subfamily B protein
VRRAAVARVTRLSSVPDGYATTIGEPGVRLSGEQQRIGASRALYPDADLGLVFDEGNECVDNLTEREVMTAIDCPATRPFR